MPFGFTQTQLPHVILIEPPVFPDARGFFMETYKRSDFAAAGIDEIFVQCNHSRSARGTLRGLHYQRPPKAQAKLVRTVHGEIYDVAVDLRSGSPTYGKWLGLALSASNNRMLYVPAGFAHGFCVISEEAEVSYMTTAEYSPEHESGVIWNDPDLSIDWPIRDPKLSSRDCCWPPFSQTSVSFCYPDAV